MAACMPSPESEIQSRIKSLVAISVDHSSGRKVETLGGPGPRTLPEVQISFSATCEESLLFQDLRRSNSLSIDGNLSPTSVMGSHHAPRSLSPAPGISPRGGSFIASAWNRIDASDVEGNFNAKLLEAQPSFSAGSDAFTGYDAVRLKRKLGKEGCDNEFIPDVAGKRGSDVSSLSSSVSSSSASTLSTLPTSPALSPLLTVKEEVFFPPPRDLTAPDSEGTWNGYDRGKDEDRGQKEEYISTRRRRRLNLIVPNPRKPRTADYSCSLCTEPYQVVVGDNPWWAVYSQRCPQCKQQQVPRIDINSASNAIELDPNVMALYGEGVEDSGEDECEGGSEEDEEEKEEDDEAVATAAAEADQEDLRCDVHPFDGEGLLAVEEASKLLVLMCHARSCTGQHASPKHAEICKSTKYLMLHIRDCNGTDVHGRDCQFPWCLPCKKMLKHLTHCYDPSSCMVCNPWALPESFRQLHCLNNNQQHACKK